MSFRMSAISSRYINTLLDNADTNYAEVRSFSFRRTRVLIYFPQIRSHLATVLRLLVSSEWNPWYPSVSAFLTACQSKFDPLGLR